MIYEWSTYETWIRTFIIRFRIWLVTNSWLNLVIMIFWHWKRLEEKGICWNVEQSKSFKFQVKFYNCIAFQTYLVIISFALRWQCEDRAQKFITARKSYKFITKKVIFYRSILHSLYITITYCEARSMTI